MTPRMIMYLVLLAVVGLGIYKVLDWRSDSIAYGEMKEKYEAELDCDKGSTCERKMIEARAAALTEAQEAFATQVRINEESDRAMQTRLAEADRRFLDAADRLGRIRVCPAAPAVPGPAATAAAGQLESAAALAQRNGTSVAGLGPILRNCELDAGQVAELQQWYAALRASREPDHGRQ